MVSKQTTNTKNQMKTIHRYILNNANGAAMMPAGFKTLSVNIGSKGVYVYALVDPAAELEPVNFRVIKTGEEIPAADLETMEFVATVAIPGAPALHVFRVTV